MSDVNLSKLREEAAVAIWFGTLYQFFKTSLRKTDFMHQGRIREELVFSKSFRGAFCGSFKVQPGSAVQRTAEQSSHKVGEYFRKLLERELEKMFRGKNNLRR